MYIAVLADSDAIDCARERTGRNDILYFSETDTAIRAISKHRIKLLFVTTSSVDMGYLNKQLKMLPFWVRMVLINRDKSYVIVANTQHESIVNSTVM